jgi:predicted nucleotidyltransferase
VSVFESIFEELNNEGVRYVVVGGLAAVLHGHARLTVDVDLIVDLTPEEAARTVSALVSMGLRPRVPVAPEKFADAATRAHLTREKNMRVFPFSDPSNPMRQVDLFVESPIDFEELWERSEVMQLENTSVRVASIADLIALKRQAGRRQDLMDIEALEAIAKRRRG